MSLQIDLLRTSFETVILRQPAITPRFYEILFDRYPAAQALFGRNARKAQEAMLQQSLVAVIEHLDDAPWLVSNLHALGAKHVAYGVTPEMFGWVGDALLSTLAEILAEQWSADVALAWEQAYSAIAAWMLEGMSAEAAEANLAVRAGAAFG